MVVAEIAGAALGYIHGNWRGAKRGWQIAAALTRNSTMAPVKRKRTSQVTIPVKVATTTSRKRRKFTHKPSASLVLKPSLKRKRTGNKSSVLTKKIKRIVDRAVHIEQPLGRYWKQWGVIAANMTDNQQLWLDGDSLLQDGAVAVGSELVHMHTQKILDAFSVLFNAKVAVLPYDSGNFDSVDLKFPFESMTTEVTIRNITAVIIDYQYLVATTKRDTTVNFHTNFTAAMTATNITQSGGTTATKVQLNVDPRVLPSLQKHYRMTSRTGTLYPGQQKTFRLHTKRRHIDFNKFLVGTTKQLYISGLTKEMIFRLQPHVSLTYDTTVAQLNSGQYVVNGADYGVAIEVKEMWKMRPAENAAESTQEDRYAWYQFHKTASATTRNIVKSLSTLSNVQ